MRYLSLLFVLLFSGIASPLQGDVEKNEDDDLTSLVTRGESRLCGINALYFAKCFLNGKKPDYLQLMNAFPGVAKNGVTLLELQNHLEKESFHCVSKKVSLKEVPSLDSGIVGFVLVAEERGSHIFFVRPLSDGLIQILDGNRAPVNIKPSKKGKGYTILFVSKSKESLPCAWPITSVIFAILAFLFFAGLVLTLRSKKNGKVIA